MSTFTASQLTIAPLGSGDLIDRAVRLYRRHLFILIRIAAPPVTLASIGWILLTQFLRRLFNPLATDGVDMMALYFFLMFVSLGIFIAGLLFTLVVMGGATRNLVAHLLHNDPVSARVTYQAVRARFWGLLGASVLVFLWVGLSLSAAVFGLYFVFIVVFLVMFGLGNILPIWLTVILSVISALVAIGVCLILFFFIVGRLAYVPQAMLVEGKGVFDALGRSFSLARGNVRRLMAMTIFTTFATYSALMILLIPLYWYGYVSGVDLMNATQQPAWFSIAYSVLVSLSAILLTPVWMLGLSLLYVDERVRHEGYDIELLAARELGEVPDLGVASPLAPALSGINRKQPPPGPMASGRVLNLS